MSTKKSNKKQCSGEDNDFVEIAGQKINLSGTSGYSIMHQASAVEANRASSKLERTADFWFLDFQAPLQSLE